MRTTIYRHDRMVYAFDRDVRAMTQSSGRRAIYLGTAWDEWTPVAVIESAGRLVSTRSTRDGRPYHLLCPPNAGPREAYTADRVLAGAAAEHVVFLWRDSSEGVSGGAA